MFAVVYSFLNGVLCGNILPGYTSVKTVQRDRKFTEYFVDHVLINIAFVVSLIINFKKNHLLNYNVYEDLKLIFVILFGTTGYIDAASVLILCILNHSEVRLRNILFQFAHVMPVNKWSWNFGLLLGVMSRTESTWVRSNYVTVLYVVGFVILHRSLLKTQVLRQHMKMYCNIYKKKGKFRSLTLDEVVEIVPGFALLFVVFVSARVFLLHKRKSNLLLYLLIQSDLISFNFYALLAIGCCCSLASFFAVNYSLLATANCDIIFCVLSDVALGLACASYVRRLKDRFAARDVFAGDTINAVVSVLVMVSYLLV